jgi:hypothetical protein
MIKTFDGIERRYLNCFLVAGEPAGRQAGLGTEIPETRKFQAKTRFRSSIPPVFPLNYARFMETL